MNRYFLAFRRLIYLHQVSKKEQLPWLRAPPRQSCRSRCLAEAAEDLRGRLQVGDPDGQVTAVDVEVQGDGVAPALEANGGGINGHVAALTDDLAVLLVVEGVWSLCISEWS